MANAYPTCNVKCESYASSIIPKIYDHLVRGTMSDCILGAEGKFIRAHKLILSISSEYFENMFSVGSVEKPIVIITGVKFSDLCLVLDFAYTGQASIPQDRLDEFLKAGEMLQIRGLKEGRIHFMTKHVHAFAQPQQQQQQSTFTARSFEQTISSTQEQPVEAPVAKRPREEDDVSMQEATEIMKMLLDTTELEPELPKTPIVQQFSLGTSSSSQSNSLVLMRTLNAPLPPRVFTTSQVVQTQQEASATVSKDKSGFICRFCARSLSTAGRIKKHENECSVNPDRIIAVCDICSAEMKPSSLTSHKKQKHDFKPKRIGQKPSPSILIAAKKPEPDPELTGALIEAQTPPKTQLDAIDTTRPSLEPAPVNSSLSDAEADLDTPDESFPKAIQDIKEEELEADIEVALPN